MKFRDYKYERLNYDKIKVEFEELIKNLDNSNSFKEVKKYIQEINKIRNDISTMSNLVSIRYSINTNDEFYSKEKEYFDEFSPKYEELDNIFYKSIVNSKFLKEIEKEALNHWKEIDGER